MNLTSIAPVADTLIAQDYSVRALLPHLESFRGKTIWCPFDKADGPFVRILTGAGHTVVLSHPDEGHDFHTYEPDNWDLMVGLPPFKEKRQTFERALSFGKPIALIMANTWLNDAAPKRVFKERGLQLLMFEERMLFSRQGVVENKILFSSSYFCCDFLKGRGIQFASLKDFGFPPSRRGKHVQRETHTPNNPR